jgi:hypothetical protein
MGHVGAGQTWGGLHNIRVGPRQPMGKESGKNYTVRSKLVELSPQLTALPMQPPFVDHR